VVKITSVCHFHKTILKIIAITLFIGMYALAIFPVSVVYASVDSTSVANDYSKQNMDLYTCMVRLLPDTVSSYDLSIAIRAIYKGTYVYNDRPFYAFQPVDFKNITYSFVAPGDFQFPQNVKPGDEVIVIAREGKWHSYLIYVAPISACYEKEKETNANNNIANTTVVETSKTDNGTDDNHGWNPVLIILAIFLPLETFIIIMAFVIKNSEE